MAEREKRISVPEYKPPRNPEDFGEPWARIFLPYSDLQWANARKLRADTEAIHKGQMPPSFSPEAARDQDWIAKDEGGRYLPGHIDEAESIYPDTTRKFQLFRLNGVRQLAFLQPTTLEEKNLLIGGPHFSHSRLFHSELVARTLEIILRRNNFSQKEISLGIISGLVHDAATPAFGDPTKEIDPEALDEETNLTEHLKELGITDSDLEKYGVKVEKVLSTVRNRRIVGKLLDIADKIAYTALDIWYYSGDPYKHVNQDDALKSVFEPLRALTRTNPKWANIYQDVAINNQEEPYFTNPTTLGTFLELRARMHTALYLNPHCRGLDMIYKTLISPLYSREPNPNFPLNPKILRSMTDERLSEVVMPHWGLNQEFPFDTYMSFLPDFVRVTDGNVSAVVKRLERRSEFVIGSETIRKFNTGTKFLSIDPYDGSIKPYEQINPEHDYFLDAIAQSCNSTVVYYLPKKQLPNRRRMELTLALIKAVREYKSQHDGKHPHLTIP